MKRFLKLNPLFTIRNDSHCSFLIKVNSVLAFSSTNWDIMPIPQFIGKILSDVGFNDFGQFLEEFSTTTGIASTAVEAFLHQIANNKYSRELKIGEEIVCNFPPNLLIWSDEPESRTFHTVVDWKWDGEFKPSRPTMPTNVNLMTTNLCTTNCIYCYANRKINDALSENELVGLIGALYNDGVVNLTLTGGDILAFPHWKSVVKAAIDYGYHPFISTKTPINENDIVFLKEIGYEEIQFSLDSSDPDIISIMVNVKGEDYLQKVKNMFKMCDEHNLKIQIRTVLTSYNDSLLLIQKFYGFLQNYASVKEWDLTPAFYSPYRPKTTTIHRPSNDNLKKIYEFARSNHDDIRITLSKIDDKGYTLQKYKDTNEFVVNNMMCSANYDTLSILANGNCTLCEMLYDSQEFCFGNIRETSVKEIWNSAKALELYYPQQNTIDEASPCRTCEVFDKCKQSNYKRCCYVNISKTKGTFSTPDPACPKASAHNLLL